MSHETTAVADGFTGTRAPSSDRRVFALCAIFTVSGFCGLIYESIWSHYLKLFVGHAAYAQTVVLVVFIGGMAIGAWMIGRVAPRIRWPLLAYAAVEGAVGLVSLVFHSGFVTITDWAYSTLLPATCLAESPCISQWLLASLLILPQSILLGTTFPLMTAGILRLAPSNPGSRIALLYFLNSIGAVAGVLGSAFVLIPTVGLPGALLTAGLLNIAVAIGAYACNKGTAGKTIAPGAGSGTSASASNVPRLMLLVAALTGLSSFIYEIAWIRMLSLVIGASTDAFELMLAAFILGLALGGLWVRKHVDRFRDILSSLAIVQVLMGIAAILTLPLYDHVFDLLAWLLQSLRRSDNGYVLFNLASHGIALLVMLPATFLAGMTLPLITTALFRGRHGEQAIGFVYAANTFGAIVGVIIAVHFAMPVLGLKGALLLGAGIDVALAIALIWSRPLLTRSRVALVWAGIGVTALVGVAAVVPISAERMASGVYRHGMSKLPADSKIIQHTVGKTANIDVIRGNEMISIRTNGKTDASIALDPSAPSPDEYTMALTAILPLVYRPDIENAAVIGFGSGMTTATLLGSSALKRVDTIEIEPAMVEGARLFGQPVEIAYADPRSRIVIDDAKSYFARSALRYDVIISEPSNPWVSGVASLFTIEFYGRVKRQLTEGGLFVQWIQTYEFSNDLLATILRALDQEFADYAVYSPNGGDLIIVAANGKLPKLSDAFAQFNDLRPTLNRLSMGTLHEIESRRLAGAPTVRALLRQLAPAANSDYYPLVDLGASRARYIGGQALMLMHLPMAPVPVLELLERRGAFMPTEIASGRAQVARREAIHAARSASEWLISGTTDAKATLPRDIGLLRSHLWNCAPLPPRVTLPSLMFNLSTYVNPHLPPRESSLVWRAIRNAPCARQLTLEDEAWLLLFEAVGARNASLMAGQGRMLSGATTELAAPLRGYALIAASTGLLTVGRHKEAADFLDSELPKLPASARVEPIFVMLRGYASGPEESPAVALKR